MILKKIELANYRQHRELSVDFTGHLIAVVGRNGSGKSNFLGAIQFALTGEQPGFDKKDLLTWGEDSGYVKLWFSHNGKDCEITRRIESASCSLKAGDEEWKGAKACQEALASVVGIDKEVLKQSVFVRQTEVESCLFTDPRERELNFQRLLGLQDAAKVNKMLGDIITGLGTPESMEEAISQNQELVDGKRPEVEELTRVVAAIKEERDRLPGDESIEDEINECNGKIWKCRDRIKYATLVREQFDEFQKALAENGEAAGRHMPDTTNMMLDLQTWQSRLQLAQSLNAAGKSLSAAEKSYEKVFDEGRPCEEQKIEDLEKMEERLKTRRSEIQGELKSIGSLVEACVRSNGTTCPLCGATTTHDIAAELKAKSGTLTKELLDNENTASELHKEVASEKAKCIEYDKRLDIARKAVDNAKAAMDALFGQVDGDIDELDEDKIVPVIEDLRTRLSEANKAANEIQLAMERIDSAKNRLDTAKEVAARAGFENVENVDVEKEHAAISELEKRIGFLTEQRRKIGQLNADLAGASAAKEQAEKAIVETERAIERLREKQARNDELRRRIGVLTDVRDWFSYKNGPRVLTQSVMSVLTDSVNHYLDKFGSPFTVEASDEGMGFRVRFCDGRAVPDPLPDASMLSGGQKIALAVAFRFAVYTLFSNKLGLLSLDEPTAYLDDETIARFGDLLQKIAQIARNSGLQILMATHEASLSPVFDQTITIGS